MFLTQLAQPVQRRLRPAVGIEQAAVRELMRLGVGEVGPVDVADERLAQRQGCKRRGPVPLRVLCITVAPVAQADALVDLARDRYRLGISTDGEAFAVPVDGPTVAMMFRGSGSALRSEATSSCRS